jgi:cytochrome c biogenesis factor
MHEFFNSPYFGPLISLLAGQFVPVLVSFVKDKTWSNRQKMLLTMFVSVAVGAITALAENAVQVNATMTVDDWIKNVLAVFSSATAAYKLYFENTRANETLERIGPFADEPLPDRVFMDVRPPQDTPPAPPASPH